MDMMDIIYLDFEEEIEDARSSSIYCLLYLLPVSWCGIEY